MTAIENLHLAIQASRLLQNMQRDMRRNAQSYKARLAAGQQVADVAQTMDADADAYLRLLQRLKAVHDDPESGPKLEDGFSRVDILKSEVSNHWQGLKSAADHQAVAPKTTAAELVDEADWILANVPEPARLW